jgi:biopolymer transport protein TolR
VKQLAARIKPLQDEAQGGANAVPVIISARKDIEYAWVVKVMDALQKGGVVRVGLSVRTTGG